MREELEKEFIQSEVWEVTILPQKVCHTSINLSTYQNVVYFIHYLVIAVVEDVA